MRKTVAEIGAVDVEIFLFRDENLLAAGTENFDTRGTELLAKANWQHILPLAIKPRAGSESPQHVFFFHHSKALGSEDKTGVNKAV